MLKRNAICRRGSSLVDVVAACVLTAMLLVPSMAVMRDSIGLHKKIQVRQQLLSRCQSFLEEELWELSAGRAPDAKVGRIKIDGSQLGYSVVSSDKAALGGIPGKLIGVSVSVWDDQIRNQRLDKGENHVSLFSKIAQP